MAILSHALWVGVGAAVAQRMKPIENKTVGAIVALAVLPAVIHLVPILSWALFGDGTPAALYAYVVALPGQEPPMPTIIDLLAHHFHCIMHSAIVASVVTLLTWLTWRALWIPLLGWWSHIVIDVFTHSIDYYPSPVIYPITNRGFDGLAWSKPVYLALNYVLLVAAYLWLFRTRRRSKAI